MQSSHRTLRFAASPGGFEQGFIDVRAALDEGAVGGRARHNAELVFEEVVSNVIRHGSDDGRAHHIDVSLAFEANAIVLTFDDDGPAFDPLQHPNPSLPRSLAEAHTGGLGIFLVRKAASELRYERTPDEKNRLVVTIASI